VITTFEKYVQKENSGEREENQAHEQAVDAEQRADDDDPRNACEREEAEQQGKQEHEEKQKASLLPSCGAVSQIRASSVRKLDHGVRAVKAAALRGSG
jgi:hypothetical protein